MKISELKTRIKEAILAETMYFKGPGVKTKKINFTGNTAGDLYNTIKDKKHVYIHIPRTADLDIDMEALKSNMKSDRFIGYTSDGSDYEKYVKDIKYISFDDNALSETKKKKDEETSEVDVETPEVDVETSTDLDIPSTALTSPQDVQKELMDALEAAKNLGDKKLVRQIGNALTYFTRSQVADQENMNEEFKLNMQRIAGIIN